jgi:hypothetical protein
MPVHRRFGHRFRSARHHPAASAALDVDDLRRRQSRLQDGLLDCDDSLAHVGSHGSCLVRSPWRASRMEIASLPKGMSYECCVSAV